MEIAQICIKLEMKVIQQLMIVHLGFQIADPGSWIQDSGSEAQDPGAWVHGSGRILCDISQPTTIDQQPTQSRCAKLTDSGKLFQTHVNIFPRGPRQKIPGWHKPVFWKS